MVKGVIVGMSDDGYKAYITIPVYDGNPNSSNINTINKREAVICTYPGINIYYKINDVVLVDFELNDQFKPIIVGLLYRDNPVNSTIDIKTESLKVNVNTELSDDFSIDGKNYKTVLSSYDTINTGSENLPIVDNKKY